MSGMANTTAPSPMAKVHMGKPKRYTAMTMFWGENSEILFTGWPGTRGGHYALALIVCFFMAVLVEWMSLVSMRKRSGWPPRVVSFVRTVAYSLHVGLMYLIMLALMSFNGGVFIVLLAGQALGFLLFGCKLIMNDQEFEKETGGCGGNVLPTHPNVTSADKDTVV